MKVLKGIAEIRGAMIGNSKMLVIVGFHSSGYRERWDQTNPASAYSAPLEFYCAGLAPAKKVGEHQRYVVN